ncbi:hypothetical protein GGX14DRAFT_606902 [Mycena pura]|uniref:Uncharacterized protein n=1 Tax=Mycena pura TaxID=153505 RepID=A0AAD6VKV8_9AGAR|nr:hypothetical protein GGX14DRAFT_606902 [Mycena pura]
MIQEEKKRDMFGKRPAVCQKILRRVLADSCSSALCQCRSPSPYALDINEYFAYGWDMSLRSKTLAYHCAAEVHARSRAERPATARPLHQAGERAKLISKLCRFALHAPSGIRPHGAGALPTELSLVTTDAAPVYITRQPTGPRSIGGSLGYRYRCHSIVCPRGTGIRPNGAGAPPALSAARPTRYACETADGCRSIRRVGKLNRVSPESGHRALQRVERARASCHAHCKLAILPIAMCDAGKAARASILTWSVLWASDPIAPAGAVICNRRRGPVRFGVGVLGGYEVTVRRSDSESRAHADVLCTVLSRQCTYRARNPSSSCNCAGLRLKLRTLPGMQPNGAGASPAVSVAKRLRDRRRVPFDSGDGCHGVTYLGYLALMDGARARYALAAGARFSVVHVGAAIIRMPRVTEVTVTVAWRPNFENSVGYHCAAEPFTLVVGLG